MSVKQSSSSGPSDDTDDVLLALLKEEVLERFEIVFSDEDTVEGAG